MKHVVQFVHSLKTGGAEVLAANVAGGLKKSGYHCSVWGMAGGGDLEGRLRDNGIQTDSFSCPSGVNPLVMVSILRSMMREGVDVIVTHHFRQLLHAVPAVFLTRKKLIHIEHDYHFYELAPRYLAKLRFLLKFASRFVTVSPELAEAFDRGLKMQASCSPITNGVDTDRFRFRKEVRDRLRQQHGISDETFVIGTCSRLESVKNIELLLEGFATYLILNPNARLVIVGGGSSHDSLLELANSLDLSGKVSFLGVHADVHDLLNMFDVFCLTSRNEGLPLAVLEAMSVGIPVVCTDVGSLPLVIHPDTGVLLNDHSADAVARALSTLGDEVRRRSLGDAARKLVVMEYSFDAMIGNYIEMLKSLTK